MSKTVTIEIPNDLAVHYSTEQINTKKKGERKTTLANLIVKDLCDLHKVEYKIKTFKNKGRKK